MDTILLATDGSGYSTRAAESALEMATARDATLHVICVVDERRFTQPALSTAELSTIVAADHAHDCIAAVEGLAGSRAVDIVGAIRYGRPHEAILEYARDIDARTIVLGEHGDHAFHGSGIGERLQEHAPQEVEVVEAASTETSPVQ